MLQSEGGRGWRFEAKNVKAESSNGEISGERKNEL
jgi:hypothetical protein